MSVIVKIREFELMMFIKVVSQYLTNKYCVKVSWLIPFMALLFSECITLPFVLQYEYGYTINHKNFKILEWYKTFVWCENFMIYKFSLDEEI